MTELEDVSLFSIFRRRRSHKETLLLSKNPVNVVFFVKEYGKIWGYLLTSAGVLCGKCTDSRGQNLWAFERANSGAWVNDYFGRC